MISHATVFIGAGSETTAGVLTGVTSFLLQNPDNMAKLKDEVRTAFQSESDIRYESVSRLPYLVACLDETLRLYPQTCVPSLRITELDDNICGVQMPSGVGYAPFALDKIQLTAPSKTVVGVWVWFLFCFFFFFFVSFVFVVSFFFLS